MAQTTITEALAELKTSAKRIEKKREFIVAALARPEGAKDPFANDGGAAAVVAAARQSIFDLNERSIRIRRAIQQANAETMLQIGDRSRSIADWLVWRREVAPQVKTLIEAMQRQIGAARNEAKKRDSRIVGPGESPSSYQDIVLSVSEADLAQEADNLETALGTLDGLLSLKNATILISVD